MKKAVFLDRDGTLIQEVGYLKMMEDLRFTYKALEALRIFHNQGFLNIVLTNQSAISRGICLSIAFIRSGRSMVTRATWFSTVKRMVTRPPWPGEAR